MSTHIINERPESRVFLMTFFDKLKTQDFKKDKFLYNFYKSFLKEQDKNPDLLLFDYYLEYLLRSKDYDIRKKTEESNRLCDEIKQEIMQLSDINNPHQGETKFLLNKTTCIRVISDFIKSSSMILYENPQEKRTEYDEKFKKDVTQAIVEEIKSDGRILPTAQKDKQFYERNRMLTVWQDTEHKCRVFMSADQEKKDKLLKTYFIDGSKIQYGQTTPIKTIEDDEGIDIQSDLNKIIPEVQIKPKWPTGLNKFNTRVLCSNSCALSATLHLTKQGFNCVYALSGNQLIPGGNSDQGIFTHESYLYYSSTYNLCVDQIALAYPLTNKHMVVTPNIIVFKNHKNISFPGLKATESEKIGVITSTPPYHPPTNIEDQDKYHIDKRLFESTTIYQKPSTVKKQMRYLFNTALFFGYDTIILDDRGVEDFWLPAHHTAKIIKSVINEYKGRFKMIFVAVRKKHVHDIYKKYIG